MSQFLPARFDRYVFTQILVPLLFFTSVLTGIFWLVQSLDTLELVIRRGQSALVFIELSLLVVPFLAVTVLPFAVFCATVFALNRMQSDSEIVVLSAAGISRWRMAVPVLAIGLVMAVAEYGLSLYGMPASYRRLKDRIVEIRSDLAASLIEEGQFSTPTDNLTIFVDSAPPGGDLKGIFVHDSRDAEEPRTWMAERGILTATNGTPQLVMENVTAQTMRDRNGNLLQGEFERYVLDLSQYIETRGPKARSLSERYLHELFLPEPEAGDAKAWEQWRRYRAEAHGRLTAPLYSIGFALLAFIAVGCAPHRRGGYGRRIAIAMGAVITVRLAGLGVQALAAQNLVLIPFVYGIPVLSAAVCLYLILRRSNRRFTPRSAGGPAAASAMEGV